MSWVTTRVSVAMILWVGLAAPHLRPAQDRSADAILKEIGALKLPEADLAREDDEAYLRQFMKRRGEIRVRRAELIGELHRVAPDHPRLVKLLPVRWRAFSGRMAGPTPRRNFRT